MTTDQASQGKLSGHTAADEALALGVPPNRHRALRRFLHHRMAVLGAIFIAVTALLCFPLASVVAPLHPHKIDLQHRIDPPSADHILGTDLTGRDVWSRTIYGGRVSLSVGLVAVTIYIGIGTVLGSLAGFYGRWVDSLIMRFTDIVMAFPTIVILIALVAIIGPGLINVMLAIGLIGWTGVARLVRGQILAIRETDYVTAAEAAGVTEGRIMGRHILPNVVSPITVAASFGIAGAILTEASLSFLGLGVQTPTPSWGNMLNQAQSIEIVENFPWLWVPQGLMISLCVLSINFIGDGLRDALDPRMVLD